MVSFSSEDQDHSFSRSLGEAIADSEQVSGEKGVLLRRTLTVFGKFTIQFEEEASTKEQLEKTLNSMGKFRMALDETMNSIEERIHSHSNASDAEIVKSTVGFVANEIKQEDNFNYDMIEPKEEPIDEPLPDDQPFGLDFIGDEIKKEEMLDDDLIEPKQEPIEAPLPDVDQQFTLEFVDAFKEEPIENEDMSNDMVAMDSMADDTIDNRGYETLDNADIMKDSSETVEKRRRSSRNASKPLKYTDSMEESNEEVEPIVKKIRFDSGEKKDKKRKSDSKSIKNDNNVKVNYTEKKELECLECEYRTQSVTAWIAHLRRTHSTTPTLAGCLLRCDCGHESYSDWHYYECEVSNFTIVLTGDGTIRRLTDAVVTPQCVQCNLHPKTSNGYTTHLRRHHKTTLLANGIYLKCSCGFRCGNYRDHLTHDKKCEGRNFTLHKLEED